MTTTQDYDLDPDTFQALAHHDVLSRLRAEDPVHWTVDADGKAFWSLTKHADVQLANRDTDTFTVTRGFTLIDVDTDPQGALMLEMLPGLAPERHTRYRRIVSRGFTPRVLTLLEDHLRFKAKTIVDTVIGRGKADFVDDIAAELPLQAICELVGVPEQDRRQMFAWANLMTGIDDPNMGDAQAGTTASAELMNYGNELRRQRAETPADDIVTTLTNTSVAGAEGLSEIEFGMFFILLVVAGSETTRNATAHGMRALLDNPDQLAALRADPSPGRMATAMEEVLRWSSPISYFRRTATRDVELRGKTIRAGDWVVLWYPSANRDEDAFPDPFRFDTTRTPNDHVTFGGGGPHFCLGANLARLELRLMFTELITRLPDLRLDGPPTVLRSNFVSGLTAMPVRWDQP